jgi:hypothetical protein
LRIRKQGAAQQPKAQQTIFQGRYHKDRNTNLVIGIDIQ